MVVRQQVVGLVAFADCQLALSAGQFVFARLISAKCTRVCDALLPCHSLCASTVADSPFYFSRISDILDAIPPRSRWSDTSPGTIEGKSERGLPIHYHQTRPWYILNSSPYSTRKNLELSSSTNLSTRVLCHFHPICRLVFSGMEKG